MRRTAIAVEASSARLALVAEGTPHVSIDIECLLENEKRKTAFECPYMSLQFHLVRLGVRTRHPQLLKPEGHWLRMSANANSIQQCTGWANSLTNGHK